MLHAQIQENTRCALLNWEAVCYPPTPLSLLSPTSIRYPHLVLTGRREKGARAEEEHPISPISGAARGLGRRMPSSSFCSNPSCLKLL